MEFEKIGVVGLGYVGLPVASLFSDKFDTTGFDINFSRVERVNNNNSYIEDIEDNELTNLEATIDFKLLGDMDVVIICVPTPLNKDNTPDISAIKEVVNDIKQSHKKEQLVVLESTTYPGCTREVIKGGLEDLDIHAAFSPERINPGNKKNLADIPKVIGGVTEEAADLAYSLYDEIFSDIFRANDAETAEMSKLLENTFRNVNIGLVNELARAIEDIDINEVIDAAASKPYGFMEFRPGPGIGGHCIPIDPYYLVHGLDKKLPIVESGTKSNEKMRAYTIGRMIEVSSKINKNLTEIKVLMLGLAFKKNVSDYRNSPSVEIYKKLKDIDIEVDYSDPYIPQYRDDSSVSITPNNLQKYDLVMITTAHDNIDYDIVLNNAELILDTRGVYGTESDNLHKL